MYHTILYDARYLVSLTEQHKPYQVPKISKKLLQLFGLFQVLLPLVCPLCQLLPVVNDLCLFLINEFTTGGLLGYLLPPTRQGNYVYLYYD